MSTVLQSAAPVRAAVAGTESELALGRLERSVMEVLWARGEGNVRDVIEQLARPLAYTTVMTTLDRLFKKGLLGRRKCERAFLYTPRYSRLDWVRRRAGSFVAGFLSGAGAAPASARELLVSCLIDAVGHHDTALLDELEREIRLKRKQLKAMGNS